MSNLKALIVGVSNYYLKGAADLPFCKNDLNIMEESLHLGLNLKKEDIISCGKSGEVKKEDFINALSKMSSLANENDTLIFYFSGHGSGKEIGDDHYLVFSDGFISTQEFIKHCEMIPAKSKAMFLDCCHSGNYSVNGTSKFDINKTVAEFQGKGYAVFASSKPEQYSYGHPDKPISVFTSFLGDAFRDKHIIKKGKVTLHDIQKLVSLYLEVWNKKNPDIQQHPIFRANMGGTIFFDVQDYEPYYTSKIYEEYDDFIIYTVDPVHTGSKKRYAVKVILKEPFSLKEIGKISLEVKDKVRSADVYNNEISERKWKGKLANIIWVYFGRDESDMLRGNFLCHTTWVDDKQDKKKWYEVDNKDTFLLNNIHYNLHSYYEQLKVFNDENRESKDKLVFKTREILTHMLSSAESVISLYREYKNEILSEEDLINKMEHLISEIEKYYFISHDIGIAPDDLHFLDQACRTLIGTIYDFTLFYNKRYVSKRTEENRKVCMEMAIKQYYLDLDEVKKIEEQLLLK
ncbi:caspase family protein [Priestia megaterium]|uniref:caspase family protein n=1 Tax=Priestia megaterium TaxID=1404 RepID=UPI0020D276D4|nr:caspase family protein [Priestia megaterium]